MSLFITFEGIEGCGKSTQAALLAEHLRNEGHCVLLTHEPGDTPATAWIRTLLADPASDLDDRAELLLFLADRAQHVTTIIRPALERGEIVVCDRYSDSTIAYQGFGRGHDLKMLESLDRWASQATVPDLTMWIDTDIETGLARARRRRGGDGDRFEAQPEAFHKRIRNGFAALQSRFPERIQRLDGGASVEETFTRVKDLVQSRLS